MQIEITPAILISAAGILLTLITLVYARFGVHLTLIERITKSEVKIDIFWRIVENQLPHLGLLAKAPTHLRMDDLIDRFTAREASINETYELREHLKGRLDELGDAYAQKKKEVIAAGGTELPDSGSIVATIQLLAWVEFEIETYEYNREHRHRPSGWLRWIRSILTGEGERHGYHGGKP